jgi:hypothetical protein
MPLSLPFFLFLTQRRGDAEAQSKQSEIFERIYIFSVPPRLPASALRIIIKFREKWVLAKGALGY